jgi:hypothetical protein
MEVRKMIELIAQCVLLGFIAGTWDREYSTPVFKRAKKAETTPDSDKFSKVVRDYMEVGKLSAVEVNELSSPMEEQLPQLDVEET